MEFMKIICDCVALWVFYFTDIVSVSDAPEKDVDADEAEFMLHSYDKDDKLPYNCCL